MREDRDYSLVASSVYVPSVCVWSVGECEFGSVRQTTHTVTHQSQTHTDPPLAFTRPLTPVRMPVPNYFLPVCVPLCGVVCSVCVFRIPSGAAVGRLIDGAVSDVFSEKIPTHNEHKQQEEKEEKKRKEGEEQGRRKGTRWVAAEGRSVAGLMIYSLFSIGCARASQNARKVSKPACNNQISAASEPLVDDSTKYFEPFAVGYSDVSTYLVSAGSLAFLCEAACRCLKPKASSVCRSLGGR